LKGLLQSARFDRFQQIIHRIYLECLDCVLVEGRHEDQRRRLVALFEQSSGYLESAQAWHLNVQEYEIGFMSFDGGQRFEAVGCLTDDFDIAELVELVAQFFTRQLFVVDDEDSHSAP
jgi:hypothetical protein